MNAVLNTNVVHIIMVVTLFLKNESSPTTHFVKSTTNARTARLCTSIALLAFVLPSQLGIKAVLRDPEVPLGHWRLHAVEPVLPRDRPLADGAAVPHGPLPAPAIRNQLHAAV